MSFNDYESSIIKYFTDLKIQNQKILELFSKTIHHKLENSARITEIKRNNNIKPASEDSIEKFLKEHNYELKDKKFIKLIDNNSNEITIDVIKNYISSNTLPEESDKLEYKELFNKAKPNILKTICGMANNLGGFILIGIDNNKNIIKKEKIDQADLTNLAEKIKAEPKIDLQYYNGVNIIQIQSTNNIHICDNYTDTPKSSIYFRKNGKTELITYIDLHNKIESIVSNKFDKFKQTILGILLKN